MSARTFYVTGDQRESNRKIDVRQVKYILNTAFKKLGCML